MAMIRFNALSKAVSSMLGSYVDRRDNFKNHHAKATVWMLKKSSTYQNKIDHKLEWWRIMAVNLQRL
jgi:hypothetical protein